MGKTIGSKKAAQKQKRSQDNHLWRTLLDCLGNFHMQIKALRQGALQGKLKEGDMVLRFRLEDEREPWKTTLLPFAELDIPPAPCAPFIMREGSAMLNELRGLPIAWQEALRKCGVPKTLYVGRSESVDLFEDFAKKLGVKCKQVKRLPAAAKALRNCGAV